jgi:hypothetical protein
VKQPPLITLTTDFGLDDVFVGVMKGVILGIDPSARVVDITHGVPPQAVEVGALLLRLAAPYFPKGTIHVAVVDPGVGSDRRPVCVETRSGFLVGPDNGLLAPAADLAGIVRIIECTDPAYWIASPEKRGGTHDVGPTFHGRDVFAPVAAHLSRGVPPTRMGRVGKPGELQALALPRSTVRGTGARAAVSGTVIHVDRFGNLVTNVTAAELRGFPASELSVSIGGVDLRGLATSYSTVPEGTLLALVNSWGLLEIAERNGSAGARTGAGRGAPVVVSRCPTTSPRARKTARR